MALIQVCQVVKCLWNTNRWWTIYYLFFSQLKLGFKDDILQCYSILTTTSVAYSETRLVKVFFKGSPSKSLSLVFKSLAKGLRFPAICRPDVFTLLRFPQCVYLTVSVLLNPLLPASPTVFTIDKGPENQRFLHGRVGKINCIIEGRKFVWQSCGLNSTWKYFHFCHCIRQLECYTWFLLWDIAILLQRKCHIYFIKLLGVGCFV